MESKTSSEEAHSQDQKCVREDRANHGRLYDVDLSFDQSEDGDDQFHEVPECGCVRKSLISKGLGGIRWNYGSGLTVEESTKTVADSQGCLFGTEAKEGRKRDDSEEGEDEDQGVRVSGEVESPRDGDENDLNGKESASARRSQGNVKACSYAPSR